MALSAYVRRVLELAFVNSGAAKELADAIDNIIGAATTFTGNNTFSGNNAFTGTNTHTGSEDFKRLKAQQGTAVVAGDFALSAGFGSTASVAVLTGSTDTKGQITITSAGSGAGASPTCTLTFKDGTFGAAPVAVACRGGGSQRTVPVDVTCTATTMVLTLLGTASAGETYVIDYFVIL